MTFDIRQHLEINSKGRSQCPKCLVDGKTGLNLSVADSGAYKCHRGCSTQDIRSALGTPKPQTSAAPPPSPNKNTITAKQVDQAHERLLSSTKCLPWLLSRGIPIEAIKHHKLGAARAKVGPGHLPAISIPIEQAPGRYGQKKRIAPWLDGNDTARNGAPAWSQYGLSATTYSTHSPPAAQEIWLCEGEWDAISLGWAVQNSEDLKNAIHVACFTCGAGNIPPANEIDRMPNLPIITFYDLDQPGAKGAQKLQHRFKDRVRIATVPAPASPPEGWDISDALAKGFGLIEVAQAAEAATAWTEPQASNPLRDRLVTNDELLARAADFQDFLIPDLLPADELILLAGPPREGKGYIALGAAISVATGGKFLDRRCTQGSVLYVNLEDSESKIKQRQQRMEVCAGMPITWLDKFKLSELPYLIEIANEIEDLRLIIIDTLARSRDDNNEESSAKLSQILEPLQEYPKNRGVCVLLVHHTGKIGETLEAKVDPFDLIRGSSAIRSTARGALLLVPGKDGHRLLVENGHAEKLDMLIRRDPQTVAWTLCGNWAPAVDSTMKAQIMDHLNRRGQGTVTEIAHALCFNARSVGTALSKLHAEDAVEKIAGKGRSPALYSRSFNLLQPSLPLVEACDVVTERDTSLLQRYPGCEGNPPKVINGEEGDQSIDHFQKKPLTQPFPLKQGHSSGSVSDVCFNAPQKQAPGVEANLNKISTGDQVKCSTESEHYRVCGEKRLQVVRVTSKGAIVNHNGWAITRVIPVKELERLTN